jgi:PIN domain
MVAEEADPPINAEPARLREAETMETSSDLPYNALCIDTNIFYETGYAFDKGLLAQLDQFAESPVQVVISEIVDKEMKRHLIERIKEARGAVEKAFKKAQQELQIPEGNVTRARKALITGVPDEEIAQSRLDLFYQRCDAIVVPAESASSREVLDRYFKHEPPFEAIGDKKAEFPDAYALMSVEKWAQESGSKVLTVSKDQGWKAFCEQSEYLVHRTELGSALKLFQPHSGAARRLLTELNRLLLAQEGDDDVSDAITDGITAAVDDMEVDVEADSQYYWEASGAEAQYKSHEFHRLTDTLVDIDLVRITEMEMTVRLSVTIICDVYASFELSMTDPIDKDQVSLGSQNQTVEDNFDSDVLVTFEGDYVNGFAAVSVKTVEVVDKIQRVNFGEIEMDWGRDDHEAPAENIPVYDDK